jgi:iron-only hydrogenase group A
MEEIKITVNNKEITAYKGETVLTALRREGIDIPTLCHVEGLSPTGACRVCLVELESNNALIPGCSSLVFENMKINTHSRKAINARKTIIELLLADHPDDCLYCVKQGDCELSRLAQQYGVRERIRKPILLNNKIDLTSPSIIRDPDKCILCGKCVRVCEEIQNVSAIDFTKRGSKTEIACACNETLNTSRCINCGQCIVVCPTGALSENSSVEVVVEALNDPERIVIFQHAPAISVSIAEEFGAKPGIDAAGVLNSALRELGGEYVFDTAYSADLTIMEEGSELVERIKTSGTLPLMTSCSPGWIKYVEQFYPEFINNISTCKSPQQMLGAIVKSYFAEKKELDSSKIYNVSIMPCTAKKFEATRSEHAKDGIPDIDAVLTTRELARLLKMYSIDLNSLEPTEPDLPFGKRSTAGKLFGGTGGVMEAAIRSSYYLLTGEEMKELTVKSVRGLNGIKEAKVQIGDLEVGVAVASGLGNASALLEQIKNGRDDIHFIEVMTCPGGCINGGGQPVNTDKDAVKERLKALYNIDKDENLRVSHKNELVADLYKNFLEKPLSKKSHELLHTHYVKRDVL